MNKKEKSALIKKLGHLIRVKRTDNKLTQEELAEIMNSNSSHIGQIERGEVEPCYTMVIRIARALLISPKDLMPE